MTTMNVEVSDHVQLLRNGEESNNDGGRKKLGRRASGINVAVAAIIISSLLLFFHLQFKMNIMISRSYPRIHQAKAKSAPPSLPLKT